MARLASLLAAVAASLPVVAHAAPPLAATTSQGAGCQGGECPLDAEEVCSLQVAAREKDKGAGVKCCMKDDNSGCKKKPASDAHLEDAQLLEGVHWPSVDAHLEEAIRSLGSSLGSADTLFDNVIELSGAGAELTPAELAAYRARFIALVQSDEADLATAAKEAIRDARPVMPEALAEKINAANLTYKVRPDLRAPTDFVTGWLPGDISQPAPPLQAGLNLPHEFDARKKWSGCAGVIGRVRFQGGCGSCWAHAAALVTESRLCIFHNDHKGGPVPVKLSILTIISCVYQQHFQSFSRDGYHDFDGRTKTNGCNGAAPSIVYRQMAKSIPLYMMFELCDPNPTWDFRKHRNKLFNKINPKTGKKYHVTPVVAPTCQWYLDHGPFIRPSPGDGHDCFARQFFIRPGGIGRQTQVFHGPGLRHDGIPDGSMMEEMMTQGPVDYVIHATNRRFKSYKSGVTDAGCFCSGNHAVVAIGWGKEKGKEYVLTVNSWGKQWGEKGLVKAAWCHVLVWTSPGTITYTLHNTFKTTGFANQTFANQTSAKQGDP